MTYKSHMGTRQPPDGVVWQEPCGGRYASEMNGIHLRSRIVYSRKMTGLCEMESAIPIEHHVFVVRAWRMTPDAPWQFVLHQSGTNEVLYADCESGLLSALSRRLDRRQEDRATASHSTTS